MQLGAFSVGLAVQDLAASMEFYGKLGFTQYAGDPGQNWVIMKNGNANVGLFKDMLEKNVLIFNPGWNQDAEPLDSFTDVRELQKQLKAQGVPFATEADPATAGPASCIVIDPDGNPVYLDQHV
ncbi:VOC family protein [Arthrobacter sp. MPF02]|uniref:VOC family protein n=1 Tax=Arthrobacter sp. MPF02 TaxID=3388492 RepID=UPI003985508F